MIKMNIKSILAAALGFGLLAVGCTKEQPTSLDNISLDKTYVSFKTEGESIDYVIKTSEAWAFAKNVKTGTTKDENGKSVDVMSELPTWLKASTLSGEKGETTVTFTAEPMINPREAELKIEVGDKAQFIMVRQGEMTVSPATCAEVIAGPDSKNYRITGTVKNLNNTTYGNYDVVDETGSVYVYGTLDAKGATKNFSSLGIEVGDIVTVEGPKTTYGSTVELVNVTVVKIVKSLIKIERIEIPAFKRVKYPELDSVQVAKTEVTLPQEGSKLAFKITWKGNGPFFTIPKDDSQTIDVQYEDFKVIKGEKDDYGVSVDTTVFNFTILPNETTTYHSGHITFTSGTSSVDYQINQAGLPLQGGTLEKPFTIAEAIDAAASLASGTENPQEVYIKGKFARWNKDADAFGANTYGNASFWLSDDGESHNDKTKEFEGYRIKWFGDAKWAEGNANLCKGDVIVLKVTLKNYNGTIENGTVGSLISVNGLTTDVNGLGNVDYPLNITGAIAFCQTLESGVETENYYYVRGKFARWNKDNGADELAQYGNGTFWLSEDGVASNDKTKEFEGYRIKWYGDNKWVEGNAVPVVGDEMVLYCTLKNYNGTSENGKGYLYSLNGATK